MKKKILSAGREINSESDQLNKLARKNSELINSFEMRR